MSDLNTFSATDAKKFFDEYYIPSNMVVAVVGDVTASETVPLLEKYLNGFRHTKSRTSAPPPSRRRTRSGEWFCRSWRNRFIWRDTIVRIFAARTTRFMTRSPT